MIFILAFSGCQKQSGTSKANPAVFTASDHVEVPAIVISKLKKLVTEKLKDPNSAVFENEEYFVDRLDVDGKLYLAGYKLCGRINAKNSYGGYSGSTPFLSILQIDDGGVIRYSTADILSESADTYIIKSFENFYNEMCKNTVSKV